MDLFSTKYTLLFSGIFIYLHTCQLLAGSVNTVQVEGCDGELAISRVDPDKLKSELISGFGYILTNKNGTRRIPSAERSAAEAEKVGRNDEYWCKEYVRFSDNPDKWCTFDGVYAMVDRWKCNDPSTKYGKASVGLAAAEAELTYAEKAKKVIEDVLMGVTDVELLKPGDVIKEYKDQIEKAENRVDRLKKIMASTESSIDIFDERLNIALSDINNSTESLHKLESQIPINNLNKIINTENGRAGKFSAAKITLLRAIKNRSLVLDALNNNSISLYSLPAYFTIEYKKKINQVYAQIEKVNISMQAKELRGKGLSKYDLMADNQLDLDLAELGSMTTELNILESKIPKIIINANINDSKNIDNQVSTLEERVFDNNKTKGNSDPIFNISPSLANLEKKVFGDIEQMEHEKREQEITDRAEHERENQVRIADENAEREKAQRLANKKDSDAQRHAEQHRNNKNILVNLPSNCIRVTSKVERKAERMVDFQVKDWEKVGSLPGLSNVNLSIAHNEKNTETNSSWWWIKLDTISSKDYGGGPPFYSFCLDIIPSLPGEENRTRPPAPTNPRTCSEAEYYNGNEHVFRAYTQDFYKWPENSGPFQTWGNPTSLGSGSYVHTNTLNICTRNIEITW